VEKQDKTLLHGEPGCEKSEIAAEIATKLKMGLRARQSVHPLGVARQRRRLWMENALVNSLYMKYCHFIEYSLKSIYSLSSKGPHTLIDA
jgi:hypothetical protein